jgi:hypothetical protein
LDFGEQGFFGRAQFLAPARLTLQRLARAAFGDAFPLIELGRIDLILIAHLTDRQVRAATFFQNLPLGIGGKLPTRSRFVVAFHTAAPGSWIFYSNSDENVPVSLSSQSTT